MLIFYVVQLCTQIGDLRSVIVKEACRTVAIASHVMKSQFAAVAEFLWPYIVKQVAVKISVISSSANRCLKIIIVSNSDTRLLQAVCEGGLNKNPGIRMSSLECLCLAAALWTNEALTR